MRWAIRCGRCRKVRNTLPVPLSYVRATFSPVCPYRTVQYQSSSQRREDVCFSPGRGWNTSLSLIAEEGLASSGGDHAKRREGKRHGHGKGGRMLYLYSVLRLDDILTPRTKYPHTPTPIAQRPGWGSGWSTQNPPITYPVHVPSTSGVVL